MVANRHTHPWTVMYDRGGMRFRTWGEAIVCALKESQAWPYSKPKVFKAP